MSDKTSLFSQPARPSPTSGRPIVRAPAQPDAHIATRLISADPGSLRLRAHGGRLAGIDFVDADTPKTEEAAANGPRTGGDASETTGDTLPTARHPAAADLRILDEAARQLTAYFAGERTTFDLSLASSGTPFQEAVWDALRAIPHGETISYAALATWINRPCAARAVGSACGRNPLPIIVPCHRVVASDGSLGGFGGGLDWKRHLLALETPRVPAG